MENYGCPYISCSMLPIIKRNEGKASISTEQLNIQKGTLLSEPEKQKDIHCYPKRTEN